MRLAHLAPAGAVLVALGVIAGAAQLAGPSVPAPAHAAAQQVAVTSAIRACPPVAGGGSGTVAFIAQPGSTSATEAAPAATTGAASTGAASTGAGSAQLAPLPLAGAALRAATPVSPAASGMLSLLTIPAAQSAARKSGTVLQAWSVTASGTMAQAMEAEEAAGSGLASVRCGEPGSDLWFTGPGQQGAQQIQLDLMNVDTLAASVDVNVITDAGPVQAGDDTGITVPPRQTVTESLSALAAGSSVVAIEVRTSIGRVAADVSESTSAGSTASWLPATVAPSDQLVIPGVASSGSNAKLYIAVPGGANAQINVVAFTAQGQYRPFGSQAVDLPGDSASYVPLTPLGGTVSALELSSNVPVTAAVLVPGSGFGAFATASAPVTQQAVVAGNASGTTTTVALTAPSGPAHVRLTELAPAHAGAGQQVTASQLVTVPAGRTLDQAVTVPPGAAHGAAFAVVITPLAGSGPLYAARVATQGQNSVVSIIPAVSALSTISLPAVRNSYTAISP